VATDFDGVSKAKEVIKDLERHSIEDDVEDATDSDRELKAKKLKTEGIH
jgi:hypothetical protein